MVNFNALFNCYTVEKFIMFIEWWSFRLVDDKWFFFKAEVASLACTVVGWSWWKDAPWNKVVNVIFFKSPDMLAKFGRVSVFCVLEWCSVVSLSSLEVFCCKSDVCLSGAVVLKCDGGLID